MMDFLYLSPEFPLTAPCSSIGSTVVDLYDACARMVMGETVVLPREKKYYCACGQQMRDDFNVFGVLAAEVGAIRQKSRMKAVFRAAGVPVAAGAVVRTRDEAQALVEQTGYPVVAKPDAGVGALNTFRLDSDEDLERFFWIKPEIDYMLEGFVAGTITSFDGLTDRDGQPVFWTAHVFSQGIMETVNEARHLHYYSLKEIPPALEDLGRRCLRAFNVRERFFHIEFFDTGGGNFTALEVNMRPPGGFTTDMFNYACDIDVYRLWAELLFHGRPAGRFERKYHCCYASRKADKGYAHSHEAILARWGHRMCQVDRVPGVFASALGEMGYIFRTPDLDEMNAIVGWIHAAC
jgi:hypothetical protein